MLKRIYNRARKHEVQEITSSPLPHMNCVFKVIVTLGNHLTFLSLRFFILKIKKLVWRRDCHSNVSQICFQKLLQEGEGRQERNREDGGSGSSIPIFLEKLNFSLFLFNEVLKTISGTCNSDFEFPRSGSSCSSYSHNLQPPAYLPMGFILQVHLKTV